MNKQELMEKVKSLMQDEQFKAKLSDADDLDSVAALFRAEGIQVTGADLESAMDNQQTDGELNEEALDNVAGGFGGILAAACIIFIGGSILWGYLDGVKKKAKKCGVL